MMLLLLLLSIGMLPLILILAVWSSVPHLDKLLFFTADICQGIPTPPYPPLAPITVVLHFPTFVNFPQPETQWFEQHCCVS